MISVIIPLWNRYQHFSQCIRSLERSRRGYEVIVVDHGSVDGDLELRLKVSGIPYQLLKVDGPFVRSAALNIGAKAAKHDKVFFLDADMVVPPDFIALAEKTIQPRSAWFPRCFVQDVDGVTTPNHPLSKEGYGNCGLTVTDFRLAGRWDEGFRVWGKEDRAFFLNVQSAGIRVYRKVLPDLLHQWHVPLKEGEVQAVPQPRISPAVRKSASPPPHPPPPPPTAAPAPPPPPAAAVITPAVAKPPPPPPPVKPTTIGPAPRKTAEPGRDVLLASYTPTHALHLAKLRPFFEARKFAVYEKSGPWDFSWLPREKATIIVAWNCSLERQEGFVKYARQMCCEHFLVAEIGWFPGISKELGSGRTLYFDRKGINAKSEIVGFRPKRCSLEMEAQLKQWLKEHRKLAPARKGYTLIPLQLETDTNIACGSPHFSKMQDFIDFIETHIEGRLLFRQHPRDEKGKYTVRKRKSTITTDGDLYEQIAKAKTVIGINSTVLLESLMFDKRVAAFGHGLFDGHGVMLDCTEDPEDIYKLKKKFGRDKQHKEKVADFLYELIFRRQIEFAHLEETMSRNRVVQEVLAQCQ